MKAWSRRAAITPQPSPAAPCGLYGIVVCSPPFPTHKEGFGTDLQSVIPKIWMSKEGTSSGTYFCPCSSVCILFSLPQDP